ncbi:MAG: hypothetical protein ACREOF_13925 [Gemmatimonadales bacterium]
MSDGAGPVLPHGRWTRRSLGALAFVGLSVMPARAQQVATRSAPVAAGADSADVIASDAYLAGGLHRFLLGGRYRRVWAEPIRVPVLDLDRFAGGLTPKERGGGFQTRSLQFTSADGREFRFRSLDKNPAQKLPERLRTSAIRNVVRDQTSALHPGGPLAAAVFAEAAGLPHPAPRLVLMPDDPRLGAFRAEFGGMLGAIEVHPDEGPDETPGFAGFRNITDTEELAPRLNAGPDDRVDAHAYLTARLLDMFINDWDRHQGNWRWGTRDPAPPHRWIPIAKDRDQVFAWYGGVLLGIVRLRDPRLVPFTHDYKLRGLTANAAALDRRFLAELERPVWDSIARLLQTRFTDSVIAGALERMPDPYRQLTADEIAAKLRSRREKLPRVAEAYYAQLARVVDVHGTDVAELLRVRHRPDGSVEVTLESRGSPRRHPHFGRGFLPDETREVRVYLHGGDDSVAVEGGRGARVVVRVIAGKGRDSFASGDSTAGIRAYHEPGGSAWYPPDSLVDPALDRRPWPVGSTGEREPPYVNRGGRFVPGFSAGYVSELGVVLEGDLALVRYGFRREPHASRLSLSVAHATGLGAWRAELAADLARESSPMFLRIEAGASGLERPWFFGLGNETVRDAPADAYRVSHRQYHSALEVGRRSEHWVVAAGPFVRYARSGPPELAAPPFGRGAGDYGFAGVAVRAALGRNAEVHPRRGVRLQAGATLVPGTWDAAGTFGSVRASAATYLALPVPLSPVLALRGGAARAWGPYPWFESPALGGEASLRGHDLGRLAGDAAVYGGAELRARLFGFSLGVPGDFGVLGLTDVGRVWLDGERSGRWHSAWGGGVWLSVVDQAATLSATLADGERTTLYVRGGFAF